MIHQKHQSKHWNIIERKKISYIICIHDEYMNLRPSILYTDIQHLAFGGHAAATNPRSTGQQNESQRFLPREIPPKSFILIYPDIPWMIFRFEWTFPIFSMAMIVAGQPIKHHKTSSISAYSKRSYSHRGYVYSNLCKPDWGFPTSGLSWLQNTNQTLNMLQKRCFEHFSFSTQMASIMLLKIQCIVQ